MGLDPTPNEKYATTDKGVKVLAFRRVVRDSVAAHEARTGKNATDKEVQEIVDNLIVKGVKPGSGVAGFWETEQRGFEVKPGESIVVKRADIPRDEVQKIEAALRRNGRAITDEAVVTLYTNKILRMRGTIRAGGISRSDPSLRVPD